MSLGTIGLASASTIIAAIISKANTRGTLYPVLSFPILLPLLLSVINGTKLAVEGAQFIDAVNDLQLLAGYDIALNAVAYLLFPFIWKE
jgi:heme exporter protein B